MYFDNKTAVKGRGRFLRFVPLILWTALILYLGSGQGSMAETSRFIGPLIDLFFPAADDATRLVIHSLIRKAAHFIEYFILAFLVVRALSKENYLNSTTKRAIITIFLVLLVAIIDEGGQSFRSSRTGSAYDVLLDLIGGVAGWITASAIYKGVRDPNGGQTIKL